MRIVDASKMSNNFHEKNKCEDRNLRSFGILLASLHFFGLSCLILVILTCIVLCITVYLRNKYEKDGMGNQKNSQLKNSGESLISLTSNILVEEKDFYPVLAVQGINSRFYSQHSNSDYLAYLSQNNSFMIPKVGKMTNKSNVMHNVRSAPAVILTSNSTTKSFETVQEYPKEEHEKLEKTKYTIEELLKIKHSKRPQYSMTVYKCFHEMK